MYMRAQELLYVHLDSGIPILGTSNLGAKTGKPGEFFFVKVSIDILFKYFSFLAYKRKVQLLYEMLGTLIEALKTFTVRQS